jgi:hypothetical protein
LCIAAIAQELCGTGGWLPIMQANAAALSRFGSLAESQSTRDTNVTFNSQDLC